MKKLTAENRHKILSSGKKIVVKIGASWCGPCKMYDKTLETLPEDIELYSFDIDDDNEWAKELRITSVPTTVVVNDGVEEKRLTGIQSKETVLSLLA